MIADIISYITRREGKKFLQLAEPSDDSFVSSSMLGSGQQAALYVHIPFCRTLCPFCCFNRYLFKEDKAREYFKSLKRELDLYTDRGFEFSSVYFGGGTPPILMDELLAFIDDLKSRFNVGEISLESTPAEINPAMVKALEQAGIKRFSIGIQSFDNAVLKSMGRVTSTAEEAKEKVLMAQGKFDTVNIDLIFNFPFQSLSQFEADVRLFKDMKIDQATFYPLMASPHKRSAMERRFNRVDAARESKFYDIILRELYDGGYRASTAWCYSRGDRMIDEYIIDFDDYVGIGSGSVSIVNGNFYVNSFSLERYADFIERGKLPVIGWRKLSEREALRYYLLTALFGLTVDAAKFRRRFGSDVETKLRLELTALRALGLVKGKDKIQVTRRGMFPVNIMMRDFFASLNGLRERCIEKQI
jgi:coproporphyrinogen III oxidase-like Fe-S oxidoreductase